MQLYHGLFGWRLSKLFKLYFSWIGKCLHELYLSYLLKLYFKVKDLSLIVFSFGKSVKLKLSTSSGGFREECTFFFLALFRSKLQKLKVCVKCHMFVIRKRQWMAVLRINICVLLLRYIFYYFTSPLRFNLWWEPGMKLWKGSWK